MPTHWWNLNLLYVKSSLSGFTCILHAGTPKPGLLPGVCLERGPMSPSSIKPSAGVWGGAGGGTRKRWPFNHHFAANSLRLRGLQDQTSWREQQGPTFPEPGCSRLTCPDLGQISMPAQCQVTRRESPSLTVRSCSVLRPPDFLFWEGALFLSHPCLILVTHQGGYHLGQSPAPSLARPSPKVPSTQHSPSPAAPSHQQSPGPAAPSPQQHH